MRSAWPRTARCRAVITVAALYGLLLQLFLVSLQPIPPSFGPDGVICAAHDGTPANEDTACPQHLCCLAAHLAQPHVLPAPVSVALAVPYREAVAPVWRPAERPPVRGPPNFAVSSRGPPAA